MALQSKSLLVPLSESRGKEASLSDASSEMDVDVNMDITVGMVNATHPSTNLADEAVRHRRDTRSCSRCISSLCNKGFISNTISCILLVVGVILVYFRVPVVSPYVLSFGLFSFAGGITNWLAVKMLFDKVPFLYGSGVIPNKHKEIRRSIKHTIMDMFFDKDFLDVYIADKVRIFMGSLQLEMRIQEVLESEDFDRIIDEKLYDLSNRPEGLYLALMSVQVTSLKPLIRPFLTSISSDVAPLLLHLVEPNTTISADAIHREVDKLLTYKLRELTPEMVKKLLEDVIREHLGWLIVWGNIFGGLVGVIAQVSGLAQYLNEQ